MKLLAITWVVLFNALSQAAFTQVQLQASMSLGEQRAFYVGMDLSASYVAVAVAFPNDTTSPIARIEGSYFYKALLAKLARQDKAERPPRWTPVNPLQVVILSKMIRDLKLRAEECLGAKVDSALVATPVLPYLYDNTLQASIKHAGLEDEDRTRFGQIFKQPQGAMAGWGIGLCHTYWNLSKCSHEGDEMPLKNLITILYTSNALCVGMGDSKGIYGYLPIPSYPSSMDFTLGYDARNRNSDESFYWEAVRERIMKGIIGGWLAPMNHTVFVHGDKNAVDDLRFREVVEGAVYDLLDDKPSVHYPEDPEFLVARGAALIVRRGGYR